MMSNKKIIQFDKAQFDKAQFEYKNNLQLGAKILKAFNEIAPAPVKELPKPEEALNILFAQLEADTTNIMNLSGEMICQLKKINIEPLNKLIKEFKPNLKAPSISGFTEYAETEAELKRLTAFQALNKAFHDFIEVDDSIKPMELARCIPYRVNVCHTTNTLVPNVDWIRTGKIRIYG